VKNVNTDIQRYKGVPLRLIIRGDYKTSKARRFILNDTNQNVWIPCAYLQTDGTIKPNVNIDFVFFKSKRKFELAGIPEVYKQFKRPNYFIKGV
jgi:hypothetical protein